MTDHQCPTCGYEARTRWQLHDHHEQVHDEPLPQWECTACGERFHAEHRRKYCSPECRRDANDQQGKTSTTCELCGATFAYYPSNKDGYYCADCVETEDWRTPPSLEGADNPQWSGGKQRVACHVCGTAVERYPSNISERTVCSEACRRTALSEAFTGSGHPNWKGGSSDAYGSGWAAVRRQALERDGYQCVVCGTTKAELGRNPDVHHIVPVRAFRNAPEQTVEDAHKLENVVSLCIDCHRKADFGKIAPDRLRSLIETTKESEPEE